MGDISFSAAFSQDSDARDKYFMSSSKTSQLTSKETSYKKQYLSNIQPQNKRKLSYAEPMQQFSVRVKELSPKLYAENITPKLFTNNKEETSESNQDIASSESLKCQTANFNNNGLKIEENTCMLDLTNKFGPLTERCYNRQKLAQTARTRTPDTLVSNKAKRKKLKKDKSNQDFKKHYFNNKLNKYDKENLYT